MTAAPAVAATPDMAEMRHSVEQMLADALASESPISAIRWGRFDLATSYDAHVASVEIASGDTRRFFVKDFAATVRPKDAPKERREREVGVYRDLLASAGAGLGTARYYGSLLDEQRGQLWMLLEFVDGTPAGYLDIATHWAPAAAALGRLHGTFAPHEETLASCDFLVHHTRGFFWSTIERAASAVHAIAPHRDGELAAVARRYTPVVETMTASPRTLVHGGCRSTNILVNVAADPSRACIIDWEEAALGAPLYDVAYLLDGIEPPLLDPLLDAYREEALAHHLELPARRDMKHVIDCFRLHMIMVMLGQAVVKRYDAAAVAKLLGIGGRIADAVCGNGAR